MVKGGFFVKWVYVVEEMILKEEWYFVIIVDWERYCLVFVFFKGVGGSIEFIVCELLGEVFMFFFYYDFGFIEDIFNFI